MQSSIVAQKFQCRNCGAALEFDPQVHGLKCDHCDSIEVIAVQMAPEVEHDIFSAPVNTGWDTEVRSIKCESCGASISSEQTIAGSCAFCDSPYIKEMTPDPDIIRPETVVPFKIDSRDARRRFRAWLGKGFFRPSNLKKIGRVDMLRGVYTPFWTYDCHAFSSWTAMSGYYYYVTETYTSYQGGKAVTRTRQVRKTRWVPSSGSRDGYYDDVLVLASRGLNYELVNKIYPFHLENLEPYRPEFLSGFAAEEYAIDVRQGWGYGMQKVRRKERDMCSRAVPGDTHSNLNVNTTYQNVTYKHILLPVWVASYEYKGKRYHFLVNGQTGEVQGFAPISWAKVAGVVLAILGLVAGAVFFFG